MRACFACNMRRGTRLYVPHGFKHMADLQAATLSHYQEWSGGQHLEVIK